MSLLTGPLPRDWEGHPIDTDFRTMLRYERLLFGTLPAEVKVCQALRLVFPQGWGADMKAAWLALQWFHRCGKPAAAQTEHRRGMARRAYDFDQDAPLILAAFQQAYAIDLTLERLHWWRFRALFDNLPSDCRLCRIMEYRVADTSDLPEKTRAYYNRMRRLYDLDRSAAPGTPMTLEEHDARFIARLRGE